MLNVEKQKRQMEQMLESSASTSNLYSPSETESSSDGTEDLRKSWVSHLINSHVSIL
jgi:hypothetical protein